MSRSLSPANRKTRDAIGERRFAECPAGPVTSPGVVQTAGVEGIEEALFGDRLAIEPFGVAG